MVFGSKSDPPYLEERLKGRWLCYAVDAEGEETVRQLTETEELLVMLLVDARNPLSKTQFRDACLMCGEAKQDKVDGLTKELGQARAQLLEAEIRCDRLKQLGGGDEKEDRPERRAGDTPPDKGGGCCNCH